MAGRPDDRESPSEGPGLLCGLRFGVRCGAVRGRSAPLRSVRIRAAASGATQTDLNPAAWTNPNPLDPEPLSETTLPAIHRTITPPHVHAWHHQHEAPSSSWTA
jgi:hypothetical protein